MQEFDRRGGFLRTVTEIQPDVESLWEVLTGHLHLLVQGIPKDQTFHMALSGGDTPMSLFQYWAGPGGDSIAWDRIHFWWADERCVPPEDPRNNYGQAFRTLLAPRGIPLSRVHRIHGELEPRTAAVRYGMALEDHLCRNSTSVPFFDLILLGVGEDGHTASLFPRARFAEPHPWIVTTRHEPTATHRVSLGYEVIGASRHIFFVVTGAAKREVVRHLLQGTPESRDWPAAIIRRRRPDASWFLESKTCFVDPNDSGELPKEV